MTEAVIEGAVNTWSVAYKCVTVYRYKLSFWVAGFRRVGGLWHRGPLSVGAN